MATRLRRNARPRTLRERPLPPQASRSSSASATPTASAARSRRRSRPSRAGWRTTAPCVNPRWVGSGWTIFNNKGKPVRQYEPFFSATHGFEFGVQIGVSPVLFYDPAERVIATLHPNHTYEKVVFDPWQQTTYDGWPVLRSQNKTEASPARIR